MSDYRISPAVEELLVEAMIEPSDLVDSIRQEVLAADAGRPGVFSCRCVVAVRRPLDLETAELRHLQVEARRSEDGWEIVGVRGLSAPSDA